MTKTIRTLAIVLAVQVMLAAFTLLNQGRLDARPASEPLLTFETVKIDRIVIEDVEKAETELLKREGIWVLPTLNNAEADANKVAQVLDKLHSLQHGLPVATSGMDFQRFKVEDDGFERHVKLYQGDDVIADLYLGNGAGVNRSYARLADEKVVYTAGIGTYDLPGKAESWKKPEPPAKAEEKPAEMDTEAAAPPVEPQSATPANAPPAAPVQ